ncbi:MAG TPA: hypothetical protein VNJ04_01830 [Gemmatimonadaceae bacterium]|nr:hypothetical protein [Gemmatimonadaceae bacterium]
MHSTRHTIVEAQARAVGLPLHVIPLPWPCSNEVYERTMRGAIEDGLKRGATHVAFGDLFLEDVRAYRIRQLHTCVLAGPMVREPLRAAVGKVVERDGFYFADLMLVRQ